MLVPPHTFFERCSVTAKYVQGAANGQVDLVSAALLDQVQVMDGACSASIGHGNAAPLGKSLHQLGIDACLKTFVVRSMNQELGAVRFQGLD